MFTVPAIYAEGKYFARTVYKDISVDPESDYSGVSIGNYKTK